MVLVVDDYNDTARILARFLATSGIPAEWAKDGMTALSMIDRDKPSVVVLDWMMPDMSGLDVLMAIRRQTANADLPVLIYSANEHLSRHEIAEMDRLGVAGFMVKRPYEIGSLVQTVRELEQERLH